MVNSPSQKILKIQVSTVWVTLGQSVGQGVLKRSLPTTDILWFWEVDVTTLKYLFYFIYVVPFHNYGYVCCIL